jgi:hypothetical protein
VKSVGTALKAHLAGTVTTLAICWRIVRHDGNVYAFTSFDQDLTISGVTYKSTIGFSRSNIATGSTGQVDNLEVVGVFDTGGIVEQDLKNGLFDYASIYLFAVNWADLTQGIVRLRRGWLGECTRSPSGGFLAELRGMTQALVQEFGNIWLPLCRADLGDSQCRIPIKPSVWTPGIYNGPRDSTIAGGTYVQAATQNTDALLVAIFEATTGGTSGSTEPAWNTAIGATTTDGSVVWTSRPYYRGLGTVVSTIDQRSFTTTALVLPAVNVVASNQAVISVRENVSSGTTITVDTGVNSWAGRFAYDTSLNDAVNYIYQYLSAAALPNLVVTRYQSAIILVNNSGQTGDITKTGDALRGIVISNFGTPPLNGGVLTWISGLNSGVSMELKNYIAGSSTAQLWLAMKYPIQVGDRFLVYAGCDKRRETCNNVYSNILNFRAEPDMPGFDFLLSYPDV